MFGPHVDLGGRRGTVGEALRQAARAAGQAGLRARAFQVFLGPPQTRRVTLDERELASVAEFVEAGSPAGAAGAAPEPVVVVAHNSYKAAPWGAGADGGIAPFIREELRACARARMSGLVVHLPKDWGAGCVSTLRTLLADAEGAGAEGAAGAEGGDPAAAPRLWLENPAVVPPTRYASGEGLAEVLRQAEEAAPGRCGLCIDTAHLWTSGVDLAGAAGADRLLDALEEGLPGELRGAGRVMFHLNDSTRERGRGPDNHQYLRQGRMWGAPGAPGAPDGLDVLLGWIRDRDAAAILERPEADPARLRRDYALIAGFLRASGDDAGGA